MSGTISIPSIAAIASMFALATVGGGSIWFKEKFRPHRFFGLLHLLQTAYAWYLFIDHYEAYLQSYVSITLSLNGLIQALTAARFFRFLPKQEGDPGYFSDKAVLSHAFVVENVFYQLLTVFGAFYYHDETYAMIRGSWMGRILEICWVFLPYAVFRDYFPKTSLGLAATNMKTTVGNKRFYYYGTLAIKLFYIWGKHFMGFFINYVRFLDELNYDEMRWIRGLWLINCGTVSQAVFLHTLRFKRLMAPRLAFSLYLVMAYATFVVGYFMYPIFARHWKTLAFASIGLGINLLRKPSLLKLWYFATVGLFHMTEIRSLISSES